jgi:iron complex transport system ATP-binding protein
VIEVDGVSVRFGDVSAVSDVTLTAGERGWLALVGPNGAGKTTLLRVLAGLVGYSGGVRVDGRDLRSLRRRERARAVAYVPQQPAFPPDMTVGDYVLLGRTPHLGLLRAETAEDVQICASLLVRMGLAELAERRLATLSGGERQRLVLARALAQQAAVLLLDEPTSALDLGRRVDALELVDELRLERGLTVITVVHDLTLAGQFADALALLHHGRLVAHGPAAEVLRPEQLSEVFDASVHVLEDAGRLVVTSRRWAS